VTTPSVTTELFPSTDVPTVVVLASGRGERFLASGGTSHKLQALIAGQTVLERTLAAVKASGLPWHLEDAGHPGMGDSIAAAVRATSQSAGWLILPADLPLIQPETLQAVAQALLRFDVVVPFHNGMRGHPVGFSQACGVALSALKGEGGASAVVKAYPMMALVVDDVGCVTDVDTVDQLRAATGMLTNPRAPRPLR
jgi:molybdenum cofactor cytidylyltransferase